MKWTMFLWALLGSLSIEVIEAYRGYMASGQWPERYRSVGFWVVRILVALVGGLVAVVQDVHTPALAFQVGLSAPAILDTLARSNPKKPAPARRKDR